MVRALDQQASQIDVARLRDAELRISIARLTASWSQTEIAAYIPASPEALLVSQSEDEGQSRDVADALNLQQGLRLRVLRFSEFNDQPIVLLALECHLRNLLEHRSQCACESSA